MFRVILSALLFVTAASMTTNNPFFGGVITYSVNVEVKDPLLGSSEFQKNFSPVLKLYVKGVSVVVQNGEDRCGLVRDSDFFPEMKNKGVKTTLHIMNDPTALFNEEESLGESVDSAVVMILGRACTSKTYSVKSKDADAFNQKTYYLCSELFMNNLLFRDSPSSFSMHKALKDGKMPLKMVFESPAYRVTYTAVSVSEETVSDEHFTF